MKKYLIWVPIIGLWYPPEERDTKSDWIALWVGIFEVAFLLSWLAFDSGVVL